jgi:hypothetical protein
MIVSDWSGFPGLIEIIASLTRRNRVARGLARDDPGYLKHRSRCSS